MTIICVAEIGDEQSDGTALRWAKHRVVGDDGTVVAAPLALLTVADDDPGVDVYVAGTPSGRNGRSTSDARIVEFAGQAARPVIVVPTRPSDPIRPDDRPDDVDQPVVAGVPRSTSAWRLLDFAAEEAEAAQTHLALVRVWRDSDWVSSMTQAQAAELTTWRAADRSRLDDAASYLRATHPGLRVVTDLREGNVWDFMTDAGATGRMLVLGTTPQDREGLGAWAIAHLSIPVALVPAETGVVLRSAGFEAVQLVHVESAVRAATLAPSVYNTQPWRMTVDPEGLTLFLAPGRRLAVLDPTGREATISVGCALFNARVAFAAARQRVSVTRFPDPDNDDHLATVTVVPDVSESGEPALARLEPAMAKRHSNRRRFTEEPVPTALVGDLVRAAAAEDTVLVAVLTDEQRAAVARLTQWADREQNADPAYRAELRHWTSRGTHALDGVSPAAIPHVDGHSEDEVPIRDFDTTGLGELPTVTRSSEQQQMFLLATAEDTPRGWLRAGEALQRTLLELTRRGFVASVFSQPIEVEYAREQLRVAFALAEHPVLLLRVGSAPTSPTTARLPLSEVASQQ